MSVIDKLAQLTTIRNDMRNALIDKGIDASKHNLRDFAEDIGDIPHGDTDIIKYHTIKFNMGVVIENGNN